MKKLFCSTLSQAINLYLSLDPETDVRLKKLSGKAVTIQLRPFDFSFQMILSADGIVIEPAETQMANATIAGTPLQLLAMLTTPTNRQRFFAEDLDVEGDAELGQQIVHLFDEVDIDWEEQISRLIGDVPSYHVGRLFNDVRGWLNEAEQSLTQNINEFVHEEKEWFPTREALSDFFQAIDEARMHADRLEARLHHLETALIKTEDDL